MDWKRKLSSRKFWAALISVILCICTIFGVDKITQEQLSALIMATGTLIAYIISEGFVDASASKNKEENTNDKN